MYRSGFIQRSRVSCPTRPREAGQYEGRCCGAQHSVVKPDSARSGGTPSGVRCARAMNAPDESRKIETKARQIFW